VLHARAEAFPLGLAVLTGKGVTAWRHALTELSPATPTRRPVPPANTTTDRWPALPAFVTSELIDVLAALALADTRAPHPTTPAPGVHHDGKEHCLCSPTPRPRK
jgi:hypothetical protein